MNAISSPRHTAVTGLRASSCKYATPGSSVRLGVPRGPLGEPAVLYWALVFFVVAIIAGIFGFGGLAVGAANIAQILFYIFLVLFVLSLLSGLVRRGNA
jgi:uncharacterized membrane protein YtjA (UPF0391 family)